MKRAGGAGVQPHQFILGRDVAAAVDDIGPEQIADRRAEGVHQPGERPEREQRQTDHHAHLKVCGQAANAEHPSPVNLLNGDGREAPTEMFPRRDCATTPAATRHCTGPPVAWPNGPDSYIPVPRRTTGRTRPSPPAGDAG